MAENQANPKQAPQQGENLQGNVRNGDFSIGGRIRIDESMQRETPQDPPPPPPKRQH